MLGFLLSRYGRGFQVPYQLTIDSEIPSDLHPTLVSYIYFGKQVHGSALAAPLFNLARQGILSIEQAVEKPKWWQGGGSRFMIRLNRKHWFSQRDQLQDFDNDLIDFFFNELAEGTDVLNSKELRKGGSQMRKWFQQWEKLVRGHVTDPMYDSSSVRATVFAAIFSTIIIVSGVLTAIFYGQAGFLAMAVGIVCLGASFLLLRYTPQTKLRRKKWEALKRYLKRYHFTHEEPESWMPQVGHYLVFALALGVGKKAIERMFERIPADERDHFFPWYIYADGTNPTPSEFASSFTSVVSAATSTASSGAGAGGGASAGGGGGGGGASGGAG